MKYHEAKKQFKYALKHQQTISIPKLSKLMQSMNMSLESTENKEIRYLKNEIRKLREENERTNKQSRTMGNG